MTEVSQSKIHDNAQTSLLLTLISHGPPESAALETEMVYHLNRRAPAVKFVRYKNVECVNALGMPAAITCPCRTCECPRDACCHNMSM